MTLQHCSTVYLLVFPVVAGDGSVGGLSFDGLPVRTYQHTGHQAERSVTWPSISYDKVHVLMLSARKRSFKMLCMYLLTRTVYILFF